jgi:TrmH family RNA methyltransferase
LPIRIVLVETSHPGNIGAVARAMKNMALDELMLVQPTAFPHATATAMASGADDVLARARVVATLAEAVADCGLVLGTSARLRSQYHWPAWPAREAATRMLAAARHSRVALLFGPERTGLTNEHLEVCGAIVQIPANPDYESLNLAQAVQILAYELYVARVPEMPALERPTPLAEQRELALLYEHLDAVLALVDFTDRAGGPHLSRRLQRIFGRANLDRLEVNMLRGFLSAVQDRRRLAGRED